METTKAKCIMKASNLRNNSILIRINAQLAAELSTPIKTPTPLVESISVSKRGFTLLEMSIVLVIIGLLVGGILVGQELIKSAELRGLTSQVQKYNTSVNAFRVKYNSFPGDMTSYNSSAFGFFTETTNANTPGHQDGNGLIEGGSSNGLNPVGETLSFWVHLSQANLVDGSFGTSTNAAIAPASGLATNTVQPPSQSLPNTKTSPANSFIVYYASGFNYFQTMPVATITTAPAYTVNTVGLSPVQAWNIDVKIDDGLPNSGIVQAKGLGPTPNANASFNPTTLANSCLMTGATATDASDTYNRITGSGGNDGSCSLRFRFN